MARRASLMDHELPYGETLVRKMFPQARKRGAEPTFCGGPFAPKMSRKLFALQGDLALDAVPGCGGDGDSGHPSTRFRCLSGTAAMPLKLEAPEVLSIAVGDGQFEKPAWLVRLLAERVVLKQANPSKSLVDLLFQRSEQQAFPAAFNGGGILGAGGRYGAVGTPAPQLDPAWGVAQGWRECTA